MPEKKRKDFVRSHPFSTKAKHAFDKLSITLSAYPSIHPSERTTGESEIIKALLVQMR
jgi:hypothetical protein